MKSTLTLRALALSLVLACPMTFAADKAAKSEATSEVAKPGRLAKARQVATEAAAVVSAGFKKHGKTVVNTAKKAGNATYNFYLSKDQSNWIKAGKVAGTAALVGGSYWYFKKLQAKQQLNKAEKAAYVASAIVGSPLILVEKVCSKVAQGFNWITGRTAKAAAVAAAQVKAAEEARLAEAKRAEDARLAAVQVKAAEEARAAAAAQAQAAAVAAANRRAEEARLAEVRRADDARAAAVAAQAQATQRAANLQLATNLNAVINEPRMALVVPPGATPALVDAANAAKQNIANLQAFENLRGQLFQQGR